MSSIVTMSSEARQIYEEVKKKKSFRYVIFTIQEEKEVVIESKGPRSATYQEFLEHMRGLRDQCRYIIYDYPTKSSDPDIVVDRLLLISWCPDTATVRNKMLFASTSNVVSGAFGGVFRHLHVCDLDELSQKAIEEGIVKK